ncbi:heterokaryon incompatibility protein-domain-containing protein [Aspergillus novoparasiticus]|uniref:Heterokaryon incompatibility protein-domain-containing protein n=1 Tax=Aspergillus novoparasiticus TaxID=986946 RepID=A0A5N6F0I5_9EURO|nr:heterokaryon incompatibility protein-domain-containing protein [Aspergillus novoparasiticus]
MDSFKYEPLDLDGPAFRLVRLCHGDGPDIHCELFQAWLYPEQSAISYEALSYTWGSTEIVESVQMNGKILGVTLNLYLALQHLRLQDEDRILWVDGICIDQANHKERGHQVRHMGGIYKQAERVLFWLGQPTYETNVVLDSLHQLQKESTKHACRTWELSDPRWVDLWSTLQLNLGNKYPDLRVRQRRGLEELLNRPWFRRVWILQEVANARAGLVCCGQKSVSAHIFPLGPLLIDVIPNAQSQAVLDIMPGPSRAGTWWNMNRDLYTLLQKFRASEARLPCDMVFALLGLSSDAQDTSRLRPDYEKSEHDVIHDVVCFLFDEHIYQSKRAVLNTLQDLIKKLESLNALFLQDYMGSPDLEDLEKVLERRCFGISEAHITAAAHATRIAMSTGLARAGRDNGVDIGTIRVWDRLKNLEHVLQRRGYNIEIMADLLVTIINNAGCWPATVNFLLHQRCNEFKITDPVLIALLGSAKYVEEATMTLVQEQQYQAQTTENMLKSTYVSGEPFGLQFIKLLLQQRGKEIQITDGVLCAAVSNTSFGVQLMKLLLQERGNEIIITEKVLCAAASNKYNGLDIMEVLLEQKGHEIIFTKNVLRAAASSKYKGLDFIKALPRQRGNPIMITEKVLNAEASSRIYWRDIKMRTRQIGVCHVLYKFTAAESDRCTCEDGSQLLSHVLL